MFKQIIFYSAATETVTCHATHLGKMRRQFPDGCGVSLECHWLPVGVDDDDGVEEIETVNSTGVKCGESAATISDYFVNWWFYVQSRASGSGELWGTNLATIFSSKKYKAQYVWGIEMIIVMIMIRFDASTKQLPWSCLITSLNQQINLNASSPASPPHIHP